MSVKVNMGGLKKLAKNIENLNGKQVTMADTINDSFVSSCSPFNSFDELLAASSFDVSTAKDFEAVAANDEWDIYIANNTNFNSWEEMQVSALRLYVKSQVGKGLKN
ncbi:hypothetical protein JFJ09_07245 [Pseudoalteromonas arctica]|uniref:hypothetical protein n=1 Tax=Pseudoalteromonas arctica TaxID=394751 RepID=UPI001C9BCE1E|nr:hypothetical protein [Pseudoalteromonas arctica]MBZ2192010.1 hypothetical protein [Pseudoalteromonas arctica]